MIDGMDLIRAKRGMLAKVAHGLGFTRAAVVKWDRVPAEYLPRVEEITGIARCWLRSDICPPPEGAVSPTIEPEQFQHGEARMTPTAPEPATATGNSDAPHSEAA